VSACLTPAVSISRKVEPTACGDSVLVIDRNRVRNVVRDFDQRPPLPQSL
jgi:hypothetical protein